MLADLVLRLRPGRAECGSAAITETRPVGPSPAASCALVICLMMAVATVGLSLIVLVGPTRNLLFASYLLVFGALVPSATALASSPWMSRRDGSSVKASALLGGVALVGLLLLLRLATYFGAGASAVSPMAIAGGSAVALWVARSAARSRADSSTPWVLGANHLISARSFPLLCAAAAVSVLLAFTPKEVMPLAVAGAALIAALAGRFVASRRWGSSNRTLGRLADIALLALVGLLVIDLGGYWMESIFTAGAPTPFALSAQLHQHFFLGPVDDVLHGRALLVDANSVYGIGNTYVLALWFSLVPLNYGTFTIFGALMSLLVLILGWWIARAAGVARPAAALTLLAGTLISVLDPIFPPTIYSNQGGFRFFPPYVLVAIAMLTCRRGRSISRLPWVLAAFAFFSTWSLETLTYCSGAYLALVLLDVAAKEGIRDAVREGARSIGAVIAACAVAHVIFALATLIAAGELPDWGDYIALFRVWSDFVTSSFEIYGFESWSRGLLVAALYAASVVGVVMLVRARDAGVPEVTLVAIAGLSGSGIAFLSYFLSHTRDLYLLYVGLPALVLVAIWLTLGARLAHRRAWRGAAVTVGTFAGALLIAGGWHDGRARYEFTAAAHLIPGGPSLGEDLSRAWDPPPINPNATAAANLLEQYFPADRAIVLVEPDLGEEALLRSGRANGLPISYPWQDELNLDRSLPPVEDVIDHLEPGTRLLLQDPPGPDAPPTPQQIFGNVPIGKRLGPLAQAARDQIRSEWTLRRIADGPDGLYVAELLRSR